MSSPRGGDPTPSLGKEPLKLDSVNISNGPNNSLQAMYGSGDNYYGAMFAQMSYGTGENNVNQPQSVPQQPGHPQANPMNLNFATAVALAAAAAATNNNGNGEGPPPSIMGHIPPPEAADKMALMAALLSNSGGGGSGSTNFSDRGTPTGYPQSPPTSEYANTAMYYSRLPNYYSQNTPSNWSYQQQPSQSYEQAVSDRDWRSYAALNQPEDMYMQQRQNPYDQFTNRIHSPYMMPPPIQTAPGTDVTTGRPDYSILSNGGTAVPNETMAAADLLEKFGCINLQEPSSSQTQQQQQFMYNQQANEMLLQNSQWHLQNSDTAISRDRNFVNQLPQNQLSKITVDMMASMQNNDSQFPPHSRSGGQRSSKTWANIAGQPTGLHNWSSGAMKRLPSYPTHNRHLISAVDLYEDAGFNSNCAQQHPNFPLSSNGKGYSDRFPTDPELTDVSEESRRESEALYQQLAKQINPATFNTNPVKARFFVIKSFSEDDIHRSIKYSIWCSTDMGNKKLNTAYTEEAKGCGSPIYLFYSVNGSGHFCGMAEMTSLVDCSTRAGVWAQDKWQGQFSVKWIFVKDVPNVALRHIHIETNDNKPVTHSRDTTEVPLERGRQVMEIFAKYNHGTSIFDDFLYYEHREQQEFNRKETSSRRR